MDLKSIADISFSIEGAVPEIEQVIHASVNWRSSLFPGEPRLHVPGMALDYWVRIKNVSEPPPDGYHRFRVLSIQQGEVEPGNLRIIRVAYVGPIAEEEMWNNDAPL